MTASKVACASFTIGTDTTVTITKDKGSYTHTITFEFGSYTGTIATKTNQTSIVWSPVAASLYAQIPNSISGYGTITCITYDVDVVVGTTTAGFYAYVNKESSIPDMTVSVTDTNSKTIAVTGNSGALVCYLSKPKVTVNAVGANGASIKSVQIYNPTGLYADEAPYTFDTVYSKDFRVTVTDSRGLSRQKLVSVSDFVLYNPAYINDAVVKRPETTATSATATVKGYCFKGSFGAKSNTLTLKYRYKTSEGNFSEYTTISNPTWNTDGSFEASVNVTGLSLEETYLFEFYVADELTILSSDQVILGRGIGDLRIGKDYARFKNRVEAGSLYEDYFKPFRSYRGADGSGYYSEAGTNISADVKSMVLQLYEVVAGKETRLARYDIRHDGYMYNHDRNLGVAEMMSIVANSGNRGHLLINAGSSSPILIQWGKINKVPSGAGIVTSQAIKFLYPFANIPAVYTAGVHNLTTTIDISNAMATKTGCTLFLKRGNEMNTNMYWFAIGDGSRAMP